MRIFLTGMMGSGKSFWAKKIAALSDSIFIDLDDTIAEKLGLSIAEIFERKGESFFREIESECLKRIIEKHERCIVATGGGTPCFHYNLELMKYSGKVIYLKADLQTLAERIYFSANSRPLLRSTSIADLKKDLMDIFETRKQVYEQSEIIIDMNHIDETNFAETFIKKYV